MNLLYEKVTTVFPNTVWATPQPRGETTPWCSFVLHQGCTPSIIITDNNNEQVPIIVIVTTALYHTLLTARSGLLSFRPRGDADVRVTVPSTGSKPVVRAGDRADIQDRPQ